MNQSYFPLGKFGMRGRVLLNVVDYVSFSIQDRSNVHKGNRGSPVSSLPQLGPSAAMMPHGSYEITSSHHLRHHIPYGAIIRPPAIHHMTPHLGRVSNDLGPPIFMPCECFGLLVVILYFFNKDDNYAVEIHIHTSVFFLLL